MRIAIYHNLPSGGGKRALYEMTTRLALKHDVDVYTLSVAEHDFCDLRPHCARHVVFPFRPLPLARRPFGRLNQGIRSLDLLRLRALQRRIATQIDAAGYDVAFVHNCQYGQSPSLLIFLQTPSVYYCQEPPRTIHEPPVARPYSRHGKLQEAGNLLDPFPRLYRQTLARMDRANTLAASLVLANSAYSRESLYRAYGIFPRICYLGVDTDHFRPQERSQGGRGKFVLSVGELNARKGFDFLIESLSVVVAEDRPHLVIVSNRSYPPEKAYLLELASQRGVSVEFLVGVSEEALVQLYNRTLLTVYAPIMEPFGFVPLESMACGTAVVGVQEGGIRETVKHNETGLLTERDPNDFAHAVQKLLQDGELFEQLSLQGRRWTLERWQWSSTVRMLEHFLEGAAAA